MESLGWLTESAVMPKKRKIIEGVGASSIVDLKAQLYRTQEESRNTRETAPNSSEYLHAKKKNHLSGLLSQKNSGVEERDKRDKLEVKALQDGSVCYAALEKKAELYEQLLRGELPDEEEKEKYCVDFFQKNVTKVESQPADGMDTSSCYSERNEDCANDGSLPNLKSFSLGRSSTVLDSDEHKRLVREVHQDASNAREKSTMLKLRRQEQEAARRQKLRLAFLKKQLEKLTPTNQKSAADGVLHDA